MRKVKFNIVILVIVCNVFGQEQVVNKNEELNITEIEQKAIKDAKADFGWCGRLVYSFGSISVGFLTLPLMENIGPLAVFPLITFSTGTYLMNVKLPECRVIKLAIYEEHYRTIYKAKYVPEVKKQRLLYSSLPGACSFIVSFLLFIGITA